MRDVCVAIKAHQGWVNTVAVLLDAGEPLALHVQRVELVDGSDRETLEPYHVAGGWSGLTRVPAPAAVVRRGRRKQTLDGRDADQVIKALRRRAHARGPGRSGR